MYDKKSNAMDSLPTNTLSTNATPAGKWVGEQAFARVGLAIGLSALVALPGAALAGVTSSNSAAAADYQLSYSAAELRSVESAKALHLRIRRVARSYCPEYSVTRDLSERTECINDVESDLVSQVNHPLLTKIHTGDVEMAIADTNR